MGAYGLVIRDPVYSWGTLAGYPAQPNRYEQSLMCADLAALGVEWVRLELHVRGGDLHGSLAAYSELLRELLPQRGIKVLAVLGFGLIADRDPRSLGEPPFADDPLYGGGVNAAMALWLHRARAAVQQFGASVHAWEVLNEPNRLPVAGGPGLDAAIVARLVAKFARFYHQDRAAEAAALGVVGPEPAPLVLGGLHPRGTGAPGAPGYVPDLEYFERLYTAPAFAEYKRRAGRFPLDGVGYHPYPVELRAAGGGLRVNVGDVPLMVQRVGQVRQLVAQLDGPRPIWLTEIGYNAGYVRQSRKGQADAVRAWLPPLAAAEGVAAVFWFKYEDFPPYTGGSAQNWGLVRLPGGVNEGVRLWPAYNALRAVCLPARAAEVVE